MISTLIRRVYRKIMILAGIKRNVSFSPDLSIGFGSYINSPRHLTIGKDVVIGMQNFIAVNGSIGNGVLISSQVGIIGKYDHDASSVGVPISRAPWVFDKSSAQLSDGEVHIEDDVWVGFGAIILSGVRIGRGSIVAAGALVTKDVAPYSIVVGNPARKIGSRFSPEHIEAHEQGLQEFWLGDRDLPKFR